mgnify:CR=1 FL=1
MGVQHAWYQLLASHSFFLRRRGGGPVGGLAEEELANQIFQYNGGLSRTDDIARHQIGLGSAGFNADVLFTQQTTGQDFQRTVF